MSFEQQLENQLDSVTENPFVFCGYKVSHVIDQNTHSRNIFSVNGFLSLSVNSLSG